MAITAAVRQDIMELAVLMNNKAPGTTLLAELVAKSNAGSSLTEIAEHLAARAEFKAQYPTFQTANEFATEWLANALPEASTALLAECVTIVEAHINGGGSIPALVVEVQAFMTDAANASGGLKTHIDNFTNKVTVATYHTITKEAAAEWDIPSTVTSDATTVATANAAVDTATAPAAAAAQTKNLTIATDIFTGGAGDDVINATLAGAAGTTPTYQANDQLDGGEGTDSVYIELNNANANLTTQKSIEGVTVNAIGGTVAVTLPSDKAYKTLGSQGSAGNVTFNAIRNGDVDAAITSQANGVDTTLTYHATALTGAADNLDVTLSGADGDLFVGGLNATNALETLTLNSISDGTLDAINLANGNTTKLVITGSGSTTVGSIAGANIATTLNTIDASAATGAVSVTGINTTANTVTGGAGNDTLAGAAGNDTISTGTGDDQVTGAAGNDNITMGAGNDKVVIATATQVTKDDVIDGGEGTDTLQLTGTLDYSTVGAGTDDASGIKGFEVLQSGGTIAQDMTGLAVNNTMTTASIGAHTVVLTKDTAIANVTFTGSGSLTQASAGTQTVTLAGDTGGTNVPNNVTATLKSGATAINLVSAGSDAGGDNAASLTGTSLATITVTGSEDVDLTASGTKVLTSVDFSGSTAEEVNFTGNAANTAAITYKTAAGTQTSGVDTGKGADSITTGDKDDTVDSTGDGADTVIAGAGNDTITNTGKGADTITLGEGDNSVGDSGAGNDTITGGAGNDTVTAAGADNDTITLGDGNNVVSDAGAGNDIVTGGAGNDNFSGGTGNDSLTGAGGNDTLVSGTGNDTVLAGDGNDTITLTTGNDSVDAGAGNDAISITGLSGADTIDGGAGTDTLTITNSSTGTLTPSFTNIESAIVKTSTAFNLALTTATDKTSLTSYNISGSAAGAANINLDDIASGSTITLSDDNTWDGDTTTTADTGNIGTVDIDTTAGGTLTINVNANEDAIGHVATATGATTIGDAASVTITSNNSDSNLVLNDITSLALDADETNSLTLTANANAGLDVGDITTSAALQTFAITAAANTTGTIVGTMADASALQSWSAAATGGGASQSTTLTTGVVGGTAGKEAVLTSFNAQVTGSGSSLSIDSMEADNATAITSIAIKANTANSTLNMATTTANVVINAPTATVASLNITVADNATLTLDNAGATATIATGAITAATVSLGNYSTFQDLGGNTNDDLSISGTVTGLTVALGRDITSDANDDIEFGAVTGLAISSTFDDDVLDMSTGNVISGAASIIDMGTLGTASYTHSGTGRLTWAANAAGNQSISSNTASTTNDTITGSAGNDTLTGNEGTNTLVGGAANDTLKGNGGADSLSGGAGNDSITAGDGADVVTAGLGIDTIALAETTAAADVVQITAGAVGTPGDNDAKFITNTSASAVDDRGEITLSGFDAGLDTLAITATNVADFVHTTDLLVSAPAASGTGTNANNVDSFVANTLFIALDGDAAVNDSDDIVVTFSDFKLNGVNQLGAADLLAATDIDQSISYNLTGTGGADTITTGDLADTVNGGAGADTIDLGGGANTVVRAGNGTTDAVDTITNFGTDDILDFTTNGSLVGGTAQTGYAEGAKANGQFGATGAVAVLSDNMTVNGAVPTEAEMETYFGSVNVFQNGATNDVIYVVVDDGTDSYVLHLKEGTDGTNKQFDANDDVGTVVAKLVGLADATTLSNANFADFT